MKRTKQLLILLLALGNIFIFAACGPNTPVENQSVTETKPEESETTAENEVMIPAYLQTYSDYEAAEAWLKEKIEESNIPPIYFEIDETDSTQLTWTKTVGEEYTVVSYEDTDAPAERNCQDIEYECSEKGLKLKVTLTLYEGYPVIEYDTRLINIGEGNSPEIKNVYTINTDISEYSGSVTAHYNTGGVNAANAWKPHTQELTEEAPLNLNPNYGLPTNDYIPYFNIEDTAGKDGVIAVLNWQGRWEAEFSVADEQVIMRSGQYETDFAMLAEEELKLPGVVLLFYKDGDWQYGQNIWRRWMAEHNYMREIDERDFKESVYISGGWTGGGQADIDQLKAFAATDMPEKYNCILNYDAVWFDRPGDLWPLGQYMGEWTHVGHWVPKEAYGNGFFKEISDIAKENGIGFSLWIETERAISDTKTALDLGDENMLYTKKALKTFVSEAGIEGKKQVPYYLSLSEMLEKYEDNPQTVGIVNYSRQEAVDYIIEMLDGLIKEHGVTVYRQDFNVNPADYWTGYDYYLEDRQGIPRTGITEMKYCEGYLTVWSTLAERNPDLVFDACAHGGRRLDLETLRYSFSHTKSDFIRDVPSQQGQNFGSSSWLIHTGAQFGGVNEGSMVYNARSALSLNVCNLGWRDLTESEAFLDEWHSLQKYMMNDYYQLSEYNIDPAGTLAMQFSDYEAGEGMMIGYLRTGGEYTFKAKALDPEANYKVWDGDNPDSEKVMNGKVLMEEGFSVVYPVDAPYAAVVWFVITDEEAAPVAADTDTVS